MTEIDRRKALATMGAAAAASWPGLSLARATRTGARPQPWLASPQQLAAEQMLLTLLGDRQIKRIQAQVRAEIAASPRAKNIPDALPTLDGAIALWTNSLIFGEMIKDTARPAFLWGTDDTPREWLGHRLGGVGTSGDNPDAIYRTAGIEGGGHYEILGQYHPDSRPTQVLIEVNAGDMTQPKNVMPTAGGAHQDIHNSAQINQDQFVVARDGSFRISLGPEKDSTTGAPNHVQIPASGFCMVGVRDILSNWNHRACRLTIRRLDRVDAPAFGIEQVRRLVHRDLAGYIRFWSNFPNIWFGGLKPNTHSAPMQRPGGWGFVAGANYHLEADEALVVTTHPGGAKYTGFQIIDPWMIAPDARASQVCLNGSQVTANADGTVTYIIAASDPGAANWLDTTGYRDGLAIIRWQSIPADLKGDGLIREFRVAKLAEVAAMRGLQRVTPAQRRVRVAARKAAYETRVR
jgi:hypothetical protein